MSPVRAVALGGLPPAVATFTAILLAASGVAFALGTALLAWKLIVPNGAWRRWRQRRRIARLVDPAHRRAVEAFTEELKRSRRD